jgi:hypothetical protein
LTGVNANFFTVAGATSVGHDANSGEITAVFPAAPTKISANIVSIRRPYTGETPVSGIVPGPGYTGSVSWSGSPSTFAAGTIYRATITLTPTSGYTLSGVSANFFRVSGASSASHDADSGVITAIYSATATTISVAAIAGVTAPVTGATPVSTTTAGTGYTGTVSWSGSPATFAPGTSYTATITLTVPIAFELDYTLTGVIANFFTVAGATTVTHSANSGVIRAVFPATAKSTQTITFTDPADITYGQSPSSLSATSTSSLTVAFTTATSDICTVSGTTLTILSAGTCTINANQAGNANYEAAIQVVQSFTIEKATPSLSNFADLSKYVGDASFTLTAPTVANSLSGTFTYTSASPPTATISGATLTLGSAGTSLITATFTPTDTTNYNSASITTLLIVGTRTCANGGVCAVGDRGPGGGYVFYVSASYFTSTGSTCNTTCKYLEVAPSDWKNNTIEDDPRLVLEYDGAAAYVRVAQNFSGSTEGFSSDEQVSWRIGQGFYNTSLFTGPAAAAVLAYAGNSTAGQWFIPSMNELNELCKYVSGRATGDPKVRCTTTFAGFKSTANVGYTDRGGFRRERYWSSSQHYQTTTWVWGQGFDGDGSQTPNYKWNETSIRPIRAFGP